MELDGGQEGYLKAQEGYQAETFSVIANKRPSIVGDEDEVISQTLSYEIH